MLGAGAAAEVPALVGTLLRDKIEVLPPAARQVMDLLAVSGGVAEHVLLEDVADDVVEGVTQLRATGLVTEDTKEGSLSYRVVHPVLAEVAYDMLPLIVRRQLHAQLARAVEQRSPDEVRLLAAHVRAAGDQVDPAHALDVLLAATRADLSRLAGDEACANAGAGLDLAGGWAAATRSLSWRARTPRLASSPAVLRMPSLPGWRQPTVPRIRERGRGGLSAAGSLPVIWGGLPTATSFSIPQIAHCLVSRCAASASMLRRFGCGSPAGLVTSQGSRRASPGWRRWGGPPAPAGPARR